MNYHSNPIQVYCVHVTEFDEETATFKGVMLQKVARLKGQKKRFTVWSKREGLWVDVYIGVRDWRDGSEVSFFLVTNKQITKMLHKYGIEFNKQAKKW